MIPAVRLFWVQETWEKVLKMTELEDDEHNASTLCVCVSGGLQLMHIVVLSLLPNLCLEIWTRTHPEVASAFLIHASFVCSQMNLKAVFPIDVTTLQVFSS